VISPRMSENCDGDVLDENISISIPLGKLPSE
jgi:hypothetical protein